MLNNLIGFNEIAIETWNTDRFFCLWITKFVQLIILFFSSNIDTLHLPSIIYYFSFCQLRFSFCFNQYNECSELCSLEQRVFVLEKSSYLRSESNDKALPCPIGDQVQPMTMRWAMKVTSAFVSAEISFGNNISRPQRHKRRRVTTKLVLVLLKKCCYCLSYRRAQRTCPINLESREKKETGKEGIRLNFWLSVETHAYHQGSWKAKSLAGHTDCSMQQKSRLRQRLKTSKRKQRNLSLRKLALISKSTANGKVTSLPRFNPRERIWLLEQMKAAGCIIIIINNTRVFIC